MIMGEYNLIDEKWLPTTEGLKSLKDIFSDNSISGLSGNPVQKICHIKLLLAIAQAAYTPEDEDDWKDMEIPGLAEKCLQYLNEWYNKFYLYGDEPFLQMPVVKEAIKKQIKDGQQTIELTLLDYAIGSKNNTSLFSYQKNREYSNSEKAVFIVQETGYALGGKKAKRCVLTTTQGYIKGTGKPGPFVGACGYLHSFINGNNLLETIWLNMFTKDVISDMPIFTFGLGTPPWEKMPEGEDCQRARELKSSFIGSLVPLCRFCLLAGNEIYYTEGISYPSHKEGGMDMSTTLYSVKKDVKALWASPDKKPWRNLTAIISFLGEKTHSCPQIEKCFLRARDVCEEIKIWSGGIKVSSNAGEQYATGTDDYVESAVKFREIDLGEPWYEKLKSEMNVVNEIAKTLQTSVWLYIKDMQAADIKDAALYAFWEECEQYFDKLVEACDSYMKDPGAIPSIHRIFAKTALNIYDAVCLKETARQMSAWAKHRPKLGTYLLNKKNKGDK